MLGLIYVGVLAGYLLVSLVLALIAAWIARAGGAAGWKAGVPVFLIMLGLVFWDWLPMEVMYRYDCARHGGFTLYKSIEQWKRENPGVAETLVAAPSRMHSDGKNRTTFILNERFSLVMTKIPHWFHIVERNDRIIDHKTGETLARYVDFRTDIIPLGLGGIGLNGRLFKLWMMKNSCEEKQVRRKGQEQFNDMLHKLKSL
ncbi:MAG TPA: hypothetical protein ENI96_09735 [Sedimenticola thiotaurini]|uniref:Uncharacterized protein n=1 Tax=Sedimenticola thiotaurini TaxID=1543721 RepID=A0A831W3K1_9GAMM|nr:hypothetical protein [Sedimenticola thiotaurini]